MELDGQGHTSTCSKPPPRELRPRATRFAAEHKQLRHHFMRYSSDVSHSVTVAEGVYWGNQACCAASCS
jgi:hypothetical protein